LLFSFAPGSSALAASALGFGEVLRAGRLAALRGLLTGPTDGSAVAAGVAGVAGVACYAGLHAKLSPAEIPRSATRGVVYALGFVFVGSAVLTIIPLVWAQ